jgi:FMN phosphatase YigB (HAD superfamily)
MGFVVGVAGNQPGSADRMLRALDLSVDWIGTSAGWGVEKPSPEFFAHVVAQCGCPPAKIAYARDRVDNDVRPAQGAGLVAVFVRCGPWAHLSSPADVAEADLAVDSLAELPGRLGQATS